MAHLLACPSLSSIWFTRWQGNANDKSERHGRGKGRPLSRTTWNYHREPIEAVCFARSYAWRELMRHRCIKRYICVCVCVYHANKLPAPGVAICAAFTSNDPSRARICGEKNAMRRRTDDTWHGRETHRYSYLEGLFTVDFLLISIVVRGKLSRLWEREVRVSIWRIFQFEELIAMRARTHIVGSK